MNFPSTTNIFHTADIRLKRLKNYPLSFQRHKAILKLDHSTSPKPSSTTTTTKPTLFDPETTPTQLTSTLSVPSTPTLLPLPPLPAAPVHKLTSQYPPSCSSTSPSKPRFHAPSTSITIPLPPPPHPTLPHLSPHFTGSLHNTNQKGSPSYDAFEGTKYGGTTCFVFLVQGDTFVFLRMKKMQPVLSL